MLGLQSQEIPSLLRPTESNMMLRDLEALAYFKDLVQNQHLRLPWPQILSLVYPL